MILSRKSYFLSNFSNVVQRTELGELATLQKKTGMNWEELNVQFFTIQTSSKVDEEDAKFDFKFLRLSQCFFK